MLARASWEKRAKRAMSVVGGKEKRIRLQTALRVKRLSKDAILPTRGSPQAAGYDLYRYMRRFGFAHLILVLSPFFSAADIVIPAQGKVLVPTDLALAIPDGCYGRIGRLRSQ